MKYFYAIFLVAFLLWNHQLHAQFPKMWQVSSDSLINQSLFEKLNFQKPVENDSVWQLELENIERNLKELGYLRLETEHEMRDTVIYTTIKTGEKVDFLVFQSDEIQQFSNIYSFKKRDDKTGELSFEKTVDFLGTLTRHFQNNGFPFVKVYLSQHQITRNELHAILHVDKGASKKIDKIRVNGYEKFPESFVKNKLQISENQIFNEDLLSKISDRIQQLTFVEEIRKPEVLFTKDSTFLYIYLDKVTSQNTIDGLIGFSNAENGKIRLNGHLDLKLLNVLDKGEAMAVRWISTGNQTQALNMQFEYPYLWKSPVSMRYGLDMYKRDTTFLNVESRLAIGYDIAENQQMGIEGRFLNSNSLYKADDLKDYTARFYGVYYQYRLGNRSKFFPDTFYLKSDVLSGKRKDISQWQFNLQLSYYKNVSKRSVIEIRNTTGFLLSDQYLENELYHIGGFQDIRGFREKSISAEKFMVFNTGYHYITSEQSYLSLLTDFGILKLGNSKKTLLYSPGLGYVLEQEKSILQLQYFIGNDLEIPFTFRNSIFTIGYLQKI